MGLRFTCSFIFQRALEHGTCAERSPRYRMQDTSSLKACRSEVFSLLAGHVAGILDNILHQSKQSLAESQILSLCPIYLMLESHLISKQALHIWVIHILAFSSAPCASPPSSSVIRQTCTTFFEIQAKCSLGPELVALSSGLSYYSASNSTMLITMGINFICLCFSLLRSTESLEGGHVVPIFPFALSRSFSTLLCALGG